MARRTDTEGALPGPAEEAPPAGPDARRPGSPLFEVVQVFLWLGCLGFGGPVAHLALMEEAVVRRRRWVSAEEFLDLVGLTNLIPGPNSTEMVMALGHRSFSRPFFWSACSAPSRRGCGGGPPLAGFWRV